MTNNRPDERPVQQVKAGRNAEVIGGNKIASTRVNVWIPFFLFGVLASGGLAWAVNSGWLTGSGNPQQSSPQPGSTSTERTTKP
ncbi:hypothetical protein [Phormidesmis priestleyi]|uniref:hypothetical protein n=1 Tax=Phormidesmis priestleyi TaxID=268141 RepID=UPI0009352D1A|nr:hypothetical protein [Phormidesmis priestleyi]